MMNDMFLTPENIVIAARVPGELSDQVLLAAVEKLDSLSRKERKKFLESLRLAALDS